MDSLGFETLLKKSGCRNSYGQKWYPTSVGRYKENFVFDLTEEKSRALMNNIIYNLQYLEYLEKQLQELSLSSVLTIMLYKNYVITAMNIVEGLFQILILQSLPKKGRPEKLTFYKIMELMIKNPEIISLELKDLQEIDEFRKLRNKLHLQNTKGGTDHDYFNFNLETKLAMQRCLLKVLQCPQISENPAIYRFLY